MFKQFIYLLPTYLPSYMHAYISSLFKYVQLKQSQYDFNSTLSSSDSDNDDNDDDDNNNDLIPRSEAKNGGGDNTGEGM